MRGSGRTGRPLKSVVSK